MKKRARVTKSVKRTKTAKKGMLYQTVPKNISYGVLFVFALVGLWLVLVSAKVNSFVY